MSDKTAVLPKGGGKTRLADIALDLTIRERHTGEAKGTENPIEEGSPASDNVLQRPDSVALEGLFSDTPPGQGEGARAEIGRSRDKYEELVKIKEAGEPFTLVTGLRVYDSMIISLIETTVDATTGHAVPVALQFQQIKQGELRFVVIPPEVTTKPGASGKVDRGKQRPKGATEEQQEQLESSVLYDTFFG